MPPAPLPAQVRLPSLGDVVAGKYELERLLGRGGMGAVFAAKHLLLDERVAIKVLFGADSGEADALARFMNEARAAARIQSEHVARVFDVGQLGDGTPYMVIEYLDGSDLASLVAQKGPLPIADAVDFVVEATAGVFQAHVLGIIHRDLKPANLFLANRHDGTRIIKVLDFGVAKNLNPSLSTELKVETSSKAVLGSPYYISPEQLRLAKSAEVRSDIWSLGVVLYNLLTGSVPFDGESLGELFANILEAPIPKVRASRPDVPAELEAVIARCLERNLERRYPTITDLAEALVPLASKGMDRMVHRMRRAVESGTRVETPRVESPANVAAEGSAASSARSWAGTRSKRDSTTSPARFVAPLAVVLGATMLGSLGWLVLSPRSVSSDRPASEPVARIVLPAPATPDPTEAPASPSSPPPTSPPTAPAAPVDASASHVTPRPAERAKPAPAATASAPTASSTCTPPYFFDDAGHKQYKPACVY